MFRILIADSDPAARRALSTLLRRKLEPHTIVEIESIETLIRQLAASPTDLLVLDWRLHGAPAPEICSLLIEAYPHLRIVLLSVDAGHAHAAKEAGAAFVHKGASPDVLLGVLKPLLPESKRSGNFQSDRTT